MLLSEERCEACRVNAPRVSASELAELIRQIPEWQAEVVDGVMQLQREFSFRNFVDALAFTNQVGVLAEQAGHHPALLTEWGKVKVSWWTHKIKGLHRNDFILAAKTDTLLSDVAD